MPDVATADGHQLVADQVVHRLHRGGVTNVGEVQTPDAPPFALWRDAARTTTYRNYLLTLKWQLMTRYQNISRDAFDLAIVAIDKLLAQPTLTQSEVQALISQVRTLTPAGQPTAPEKSERLKPGDIGEFEDRMNRAQKLVDGILSSQTAIADAFGRGAATGPTARGNLNEIKVHLTRWMTEQQSRVSINRSPNAIYAAFNQGYYDDSMLMLGADFFTKPVDDTAGNLIHEASHGCLHTTDLAYMDVPYFSRLRDELALANADNYKYAAELAAAGIRRPMNPANVPGQRTSIQRFEDGLGLCHYQCSKVWYLLTWLQRRYQGTGAKIFEDTRVKHEEMMELGGDTTSTMFNGEELTKIAGQRTTMLIEITNYVKSYVKVPKTFGEVGGVITATPVGNTTWKVMEFDIAGANTVEDVAQRIFAKVMHAAAFTDAEAKQLSRWCEALFANMRKDDDHKKVYELSDTDLQLYDLLRT